MVLAVLQVEVVLVFDMGVYYKITKGERLWEEKDGNVLVIITIVS